MKKRKNFEKKIQRLKVRIEKDTKKLAKLTVKLGAAVTGRAAKKKAPARTVGKKKPAPKVKRKLNLSPERRAQLAAAMKARWEAKRAAAGQTAPAQPSA
jgi:hypothetical protein